MDWRRVASERELKKLGAYEVVKEEINYDISPLLKVKSRSWKELFDYIQAMQEVSTLLLREELEELNSLRVQMSEDHAPKYFKSDADECIFYLLELRGTLRLKKLGVTKSIYQDAAKARKWYLTIAQIIHPEVSLHPDSEIALVRLDELYQAMLHHELK